MMKKIFLLAFAAALLASCGDVNRKEARTIKDEQLDVLKVEFASLAGNPEKYIGKEISVEGKVVHVCMHSGKKMFITGEDPDIRLFVSAGEDMPKFPMELLGSEIVVQGTLTRAQSTAMTEGEGMHAAGESVDMAKGDTCVTEKALASQPVLSDLMMVYNKHTLVK